MNTLVICGLINAAIASLLATGAIVATWRWRNPYVTRAIWLVVLLRFLVPPIFTIQLPWLTDSVNQLIRPNRTANSLRQEFARLQLPTAESNKLPTGLSEPSSGQTTPADFIVTLSKEETELAESNQHGSTFFSVGCVWLAGSLLIAAVVLHRIRRFHILIRDTRIAPNSLQQQVNRVAARIGISRKLQVRLTDGRTPPLVWCLGMQPTIVLPSALVRLFEETKTTSILAHEVMHVHRKDSWFRWLEILAVSLYWWCPFSWTARRMLQDAEERCCDADVLKCFPELRTSYPNALLETLDFLAGADRLNFAGTGFASSSSLKRRFEMIVCSDAHARPATMTRILMSVAAVILIATTPVVSSSATQLAQSTQAVALAEYSPLELKDGTLLEGQIITLGDDRLIVALDTRTEAAEAPCEKKDTSEKPTAWNLSLGECFQIALANIGEIQVNSDANGLLVLAPKSTNELNELDFRATAENTLEDVEDAYWGTWLALRNVEIQQAACDRASETWREVHALQSTGATWGDSEAQSRANFFLFKAQAAKRLAEFERAESLLRRTLGLSLEDGRVISPTDVPQDSRYSFDFETANEEALSNRIEVVKQKLRVKERQLQLEASQKHPAGSQQTEIDEWDLSRNFNMTIADRKALSRIRQHKLLLARELALQKALKLEISHELSNALRYVERTYGLAQSNQSRSRAAKKEYKVIKTVYDSGRIGLNVLLDCQRRTVESEEAYNKARVDYVRSLSRVHDRKGTLLTRHNVSIKQE